MNDWRKDSFLIAAVALFLGAVVWVAVAKDQARPVPSASAGPCVSARRCPVCLAAALESRSYEGAYPGQAYGEAVKPSQPSDVLPVYTVVEPSRYWDERGCFHDHDFDFELFHCSRGHEWKEYSGGCWCGEPVRRVEVL